MPTYDGIGTSSITHRVEVVGDSIFQDVDGGTLSTKVPVQIFSNYTSSPGSVESSRQLRFRVQPENESNVSNSYVTDMGIKGADGSNYFFVTAPQNTSNVGVQNTFVIATTSNVGIGTTDPVATLQVVGDIKCQTLTATTITGGSPLTISATSISIEAPVAMPADVPMSIGTMTVSNIFHSDQLTMSANVFVTEGSVLTLSNIFHTDELTMSANIAMGSDKTLTTSNIVAHANENLLISSNLEVGTSNLFVNTANGNVGIGINPPTEKLHVDGNIKATGTLSATDLIGNGSDVTNVAAATAVNLETARAINGVNFDGTAAITVNGLNYNVNDIWLRELGDDANFRIYGGTRQIVFRTDGTSPYMSSGIGEYPYVWMYDGNGSGNRRMLLNDIGQLWCSNYGWLHDKFAYKEGTSTQNFSGNAVYVHEWLRMNSTGQTGIYWNNSSGTGYAWHIYPKDRKDMYFRTGENNGGIAGTVGNTTVRGYVHWTTSNNIGFLDHTRNWTLRCDGNRNVQIYGNLYMNSSRYLGNVTGEYGTIQCNGSGAGNWEGYSIDGRFVFMHDGGTAGGIYNDVNNQWLFYGIRQAETRMYYNGAEALRTFSEGIRINQRTYISCTSQTYTTSWANAPAQGDKRGAYIIMVQGATNDISCAIFACTDDSGYAGGNVAVLQRSTDYSGGGYFDCRWTTNAYIQLRHTTTTRACYVTVFRTV
jgi:hypothetical protein